MKITCTKCNHSQSRDMQRPRTFHCANCGNHFNYRVGEYGYAIFQNGKQPLPDDMRKKGVQVREYPYVLARYRKRGITSQQIWEAGILAIDNSQ